jgi:hypothetical protein
LEIDVRHQFQPVVANFVDVASLSQQYLVASVVASACQFSPDSHLKTQTFLRTTGRARSNFMFRRDGSVGVAAVLSVQQPNGIV